VAVGVFLGVELLELKTYFPARGRERTDSDIDLSRVRLCVLLSFWACTMAPAFFKSVCARRGRCKMALEVDFLLRMEFLSRAKFDVERSQGGDESDAQGRLLHICNGPYNHVTSLSLDLLLVRSRGR